jgi:hypothetical protein
MLIRTMAPVIYSSFLIRFIMLPALNPFFYYGGELLDDYAAGRFALPVCCMARRAYTGLLVGP